MIRELCLQRLVPGAGCKRGRSLRVKIEPVPQETKSESAAGPIGSYPRALTLRIRH